MDRQRVQDCLEQVAAFRASGQKANVWADANNVPLRALASWCAHARRWQARLDGVVPPPAVRRGVGQQIGALCGPWVSTLDPTQLQSHLLGLDFSSAESAAADDLNLRFFARRKDGLRTGGGVFTMCANN